MSTHSSVAVVHEDGTVTAIYCHFDGYVDGVGKELVETYNDLEKAKALVAKGDYSSICTSKYNPKPETFVDEGESFEEVKPRLYQSFNEYRTKLHDDIDESYNYVFREGRWMVWGSCDQARLSSVPITVEDGLKNVEKYKETL